MLNVSRLGEARAPRHECLLRLFCLCDMGSSWQDKSIIIIIKATIEPLAGFVRAVGRAPRAGSIRVVDSSVWTQPGYL